VSFGQGTPVTAATSYWWPQKSPQLKPRLFSKIRNGRFSAAC
jgi:hypothetical protein